MGKLYLFYLLSVPPVPTTNQKWGARAPLCPMAPAPMQSTRVEVASHKIQTYQNKAKNLYTICFVFDLDGECKFIKTKHYSD